VYKNKKILGVTLARGGSKSIPKKNIVDINGIPLIGYTIREALNSRYLDRFIVSTDCVEIKKVSERLGANVPFVRPNELSTDSATSADALLHAVNYMEGRGYKYDYVVELMATNPLKDQTDIDGMIEQTIDNEEHSCVAVHRLIEHHPSRIKYIENNYLKPFYPEIPESRRQDLHPLAYIRSGSIYVVSVQFLKTNNSRYSSDQTRAYVLADDKVCNLDEPADLALLRERLK
jgi:CMP-N,N'-diacetyllegionaminic acid synthase